ncbi:g9311 [Coccomyxa elongata]
MGAAKAAVRIGNGLLGADVKKTLSTRKLTERKIPAHALGAHGLDTSGGLFSINTPRQVRVRLASVVPSRKPNRGKRGAVAQEISVPPVPTSPTAASRGTGRTAMGPWCGPYGASQAMAHEPPSPTLYLDRSGSAHFSIDGSMPAPARTQPAGSARPNEMPLVTAGIFGYAPSNLRRAELRDHSREVLLAATKGEPKGSGGARSPRFSNRAKRHVGHQVFQPSGRFF